MSQYGYTRTSVVFDSSSSNSATYASPPYLVSDAAQISVSWVTVGTGASRLTVLGSNSDGLSPGSTLTTGSGSPDWSLVSVVVAQGIFTISPGLRWVKFQRSALDSQATVQLNYRVA